MAGVDVLAREVAETGAALGLPLVATCADISASRPALDSSGAPIGSLFRFSAEALAYWEQPDLALHNAVVAVIRRSAGPFAYADGEVTGWRPMQVSAPLMALARKSDFGVKAAIAAPVRMPNCAIGAVIWASATPHERLQEVFEAEGVYLQGLATQFIVAASAEPGAPVRLERDRLTRREVQCLKLAAAGKTDGEISSIMDLSVPTVRFHLRKVAGKFGVSGRLRAVQRATALGFVREEEIPG